MQWEHQVGIIGVCLRKGPFVGKAEYYPACEHFVWKRDG
jgi:hypothetical protein